MTNPRFKPVIIALGGLIVVWLLAWGGFRLAGDSRMTAEKFTAYASKLDLEKLRGEKRAEALKELAARLNRLSPEERRKTRVERTPERLLEQMTDEEKGQFIEATMPTGFKQMLSSFEELPADKRKRAIDRAVGRLRARRDRESPPEEGTNRPPVLSEDLQKKIVTVGLSTFYKESSAQTKAEVAPLLEELQRTMESGRLFHER